MFTLVTGVWRAGTGDELFLAERLFPYSLALASWTALGVLVGEVADPFRLMGVDLEEFFFVAESDCPNCFPFTLASANIFFLDLVEGALDSDLAGIFRIE